MTQPLDLLAVFAHPDDAELLAGGALARSVDRGKRVGILDLTGGEMGSRGSAELRAREASAAAEVLGVSLRRNAGFPDAAIEATLANARRLAGLLRELRPTTVVTHWLEGRHPDHRHAARLVVESSYLAGLRRLEAPGEPFRPTKVVHATLFREDTPPSSFVVDVTDQTDRKLEALACYASQFENVSGMGEVYPGGRRPLTDQVRVHLAYWGSRIRTEYGEPFWTREAVRAEGLTGLGVSTY